MVNVTSTFPRGAMAAPIHELALRPRHERHPHLQGLGRCIGACCMHVGLRHLATLRLVHGDASLLNMLIGEGGRVRVADFGAAHSALGAVLAPCEEISTQYIRAPERLLGESNLTSAMDVWSWGVQFWCLRPGSCANALVAKQLEDGNIGRSTMVYSEWQRQSWDAWRAGYDWRRE